MFNVNKDKVWVNFPFCQHLQHCSNKGFVLNQQGILLLHLFSYFNSFFSYFNFEWYKFLYFLLIIILNEWIILDFFNYIAKLYFILFLFLLFTQLITRLTYIIKDKLISLFKVNKMIIWVVMLIIVIVVIIFKLLFFVLHNY